MFAVVLSASGCADAPPPDEVAEVQPLSAEAGRGEVNVPAPDGVVEILALSAEASRREALVSAAERQAADKGVANIGCRDILHMVVAGVPTHIIVGVVDDGSGGYTPLQLACLEKGQVPEPVLAAVRGRMRE